MLITKVILNNYGVFRDEQTFDFTCTEEKPIILLGGNNGSGKTTLFESVMLCLYGSSFLEKKISRKEYERFLARKIHRYLGTPVSADYALITIEFKFHHQGKVDHYAVTRMWNNGNGKINETLSVKRNGEHLDSVEESEWQSFVEELIPRGISRLFFFDGEKITKMAEEGSEDEEIKASFNALLGLDVVEQLQSDIRIHILRTMSGKEKDLQKSLDNLLREKNELRDKTSLYQEKLASLKAEIDNKMKIVNNLESRIAKLGGGYASKRGDLKEKRETLKSRLSAVENNIRAICSGPLPFSLIPKEMKLVEEQLKADQELLKKHFEKEILDKNLGEIKSDITSEDFWSDLKIDPNAKERVKSKLLEILEKKPLEDNFDQKGVINFSTLETTQILSLMDKINNETQKQIEKETIEFSQITEELKKIETALANAPNDDEIGPLISELNSHHQNIGAITKEIEHVEQRLGQDNSLVKMINAKIKSLVDEIYKKSSAIDQVELASKVQGVLDEYAAKLRAVKLKLLEDYLSEYILRLLHKEHFIEKVSINKETLELSLYRADGDEIPKDLLSKGEKQMLATAVLWALAKTSGKPLPFIIDTPLARLDMGHRDNLVEKFYPFASHQVVIFSTDSEIDEKYHTKLKPYISRSYVMEYLPSHGKTKVQEGYFDMMARVST